MIDYAARPRCLDDAEQRDRIARAFAAWERTNAAARRPHTTAWTFASPWLGFALLAGAAVMGAAWVVERYVAPVVAVLFGGAW